MAQKFINPQNLTSALLNKKLDKIIKLIECCENLLIRY